jgi:hypothetical protein
VKHFAESDHNIPTSINAPPRAFDYPPSRVKAALAHGFDDPGRRGKHNALDDDRERQILDWVRQNAEQETPVTKGEIREYCTTQFQIPIIRGCVNSFVLRHFGDVIQTRSTPQEEQRLQVPRAFLKRTVRDLNEHVQGCVSELVFNLNEVGISDWENRKARKVVIPATIDDRPIHHAISRNVKRVSVIVCMSAAGESLMPSITTAQNCRAVQEQLRRQGIRFGRDLILKSNHRLYVNAEIFLEYARTVFLPYLVCVRGLGAFAAEEAV